MKSYISDILEKMKKPEYPELNFDIAYRLTNESERGAVLIGVNKIEEFLERLILKIIPSNSKNYKSKLLNYPGALSSFSGKIELLYAFRIIDKKLYITLNKLRKLRNQIAHSTELFELQDVSDDLVDIYNFEDNLYEVIHSLSFKNLMSFKKNIVEDLLTDKGLSDFNAEEMLNKQLEKTETKAAFNKQLKVWELAFAITLLCLKIEAITDEYNFINTTNQTWLDFIGK